MNDTVTLNGGTLNGDLDGGAGGTNTLNLDNTANAVEVTGTDSGTATGINAGAIGTGFSNIGNINGNADTDSFDLNGGTLSGNITGGGTASDNSLQLDDVDNTVEVTSDDDGTATGIGGTFTDIGNISGGSMDDSITLNGGCLLYTSDAADDP